MAPLLQVDGLAAVAEGNWLLREVSLQVTEGSIVAVVGGAAAGKTLLLDLLLGLAGARAGSIRLAGEDIAGLGTDERQRRGLRCAVQHPPVFAGLAVHEHLALAAPSVKLEADAASRVTELLPELADCLEHQVASLDPLRLRLVDLGRALLGLPRLLLIDDLFPVAGIDRASELVHELARQGHTLLIADRYAEPVLAHADHGYVLEQGRLVAEGAPPDLTRNSRMLASCAGDPNAYADD
jgi:branched-chain amino acid transport system ATP-binding protein